LTNPQNTSDQKGDNCKEKEDEVEKKRNDKSIPQLTRRNEFKEKADWFM
jgi:hypothetical protein